MLTGHVDYPVLPGPLKLARLTVMHGANYFSGGPVAIFRVDLGEYDEVFTNDIPGFYLKLRRAVPSLIEHHCSVGKRGGFFQRVRRGTLLGHVTEHTAIELQTLAGMDVAYGKTRSTTDTGVYNVVFRFFDEVAGVYAGKAALNLVNSLLQDLPFDVDEVVRTLVDIRERRLLGPSTQALVDEAKRRGIPHLRLDTFNLVQLGTGRFHKRVRATVTSNTSTLAVETAADKFLANQLLADAGIPVPPTTLVASVEQTVELEQRLGTPLVVKPCVGALGRGVSVGVSGSDSIARAFAWASAHNHRVLAQPLVAGATFRLLVVDYHTVAATRLAPPSITGDGESTVAELVAELNRDPRRGVGDKAVLTQVDVDPLTEQLLAQKGYSAETVLPAGETLPLKASGNLRLGGEATDVTDQVHPMNRYLAERAAQVMGLDVAGVDVIAPSIAESILDQGGVVVEVNSAPDLRPHLSPTQGEPRNVAAPLLDMLFPAGTTARVPVYSVTGTAGKTTTVNLLAHCLLLAGYTPGRTSTMGLFVSDRRLMRGDMTYPEQVALVLKDPTIDCAVLETSREGILRRGLGYELADVGVVLNIHDDHVGRDDITLLEDLAYAKSVVAEQVYKEGCAVLNADQELVLEMRSRVRSRLALFSHDRGNEVVREHVAAGGLAAVVDGAAVTLLDGKKRLEVAKLDEVPLTLGGRARLNLDSILAATLALYSQGVDLDVIRRGLESFRPQPSVLPGRLNLIRVRDFDVLVDYAHNRAAFAGLKELLAQFRERKIGVLDAAGDRSDEEILELGRLAGQTYDEVVLYEDLDRRGREPGEIDGLLRRGVLEAGMAPDKVTAFPTAEAAWASALSRGALGTLVVILTERSEAAIAACTAAV